MRRILVYGVTGAGKSTLAARIGRRLRTGRRIVLGTDLHGNRERVRNLFLSTDTIVFWHFRSFTRKRRRMRVWQVDPAMPPVVLLRSPAEIERWLADTGPA